MPELLPFDNSTKANFTIILQMGSMSAESPT